METSGCSDVLIPRIDGALVISAKSRRKQGELIHQDFRYRGTRPYTKKDGSLTYLHVVDTRCREYGCRAHVEIEFRAGTTPDASPYFKIDPSSLDLLKKAYCTQHKSSRALERIEAKAARDERKAERKRQKELIQVALYGYARGKPKLNRAAAINIRKDFAELIELTGCTKRAAMAAIAPQYGVKPRTIESVVYGEAWADPAPELKLEDLI